MNTFPNEVIAELAAPLKREHVKSREQGRGRVSYIEGWLAIAEANRIFGFDGWTRETVMSECCHAGEYEKAVWENGRRTNKTTLSYRCTYRARVRVTANGIVREGSGHGHGFADNPGEAHESAEKEAETDAMKRALMTFGNPFGLALYDKAQAEVEPVTRPQAAGPANGQQPAPADGDPFSDEPPSSARKDAAREDLKRIRRAIKTALTKTQVDGIISTNGPELKLIREVHPPSYDDVMALARTRTEEFYGATG